nr:EOG090X02MG [Eulimnadia texana]
MKKKMLKNGTGKKKKESTGKDLASMDLDAFINSVNDSDEEIQDSPPAEINSKSKEIRKNKKPVVEPEENEDSENEEDDEEEENEDDDNEDEEDNEGEVSKHKKTLSKLKDIDPEFYKFLSENDKDLLQFDTSDDEEDEDEEKGVHKLPDKLEVASDDSEFEDEETPSSGSNKVTQTLVDQWREQLKNEKSVRTIAEVVSAFRSAVQSLNTDEEKLLRTLYLVFILLSGFNAIVRLCVSDLLPAVRRFLKAPENDKMFQPEKCKTWPKVKMHLKGYLLDLVKLLNSLSEPTLVSVLLKHVHQAVVFYSAFPKIARVLCKKLVNVWCSAEETVRVLAFLSLLRLARMIPDQLLEPIMKSMYLGYAKNSKFTSPTTWPLINFMRRSLVEIFALQDTVTYRHAFLYIRQLAIHLRNAVTLKKQDSIITVYNWQFVHCLHLWAALLGSLPNSQVLKSLLYPLVQIIVGTINLVATARYYPLRFHLSSILGKLSADTGVFIPVLPFLTEILQKHNFEKRPSKTSMKPLDFTCVLRVSQSQLAESGFRNAVVEQLYDKILEYLQSQSHVISFPELTLPLVLQIKAFLKKCDFPNYTKKMKQLLEKIQENSQFVENKRRQVSFDLSNTEAVRGFENQLKGSTPLAVFYASYKKMRDREVAIKLAKKVEAYGQGALVWITALIGSKHEERIPVMKKPEKREVLDEKEFEGLFPSDEEDDVDDELRFLPKEERQSAKRKSENPQPEDVEEEEPVKKSKKEKTADKKDKKKKQKESAEEEKEDDAEMADEVADFQLSDFDHEDEDEEEVDEDEDEDGEDDEDAGEEDEDDDDEDFDDDEDDESD